MRPYERRADHVHSTIIERIMAGEMKPGDMLSEQKLAEEFGISRTPVREALHRLSVHGLAERGARRAFVVRRMEISGLQALFEAVAEMEGLVSRMAALRMTEMERQSLIEIVEEGQREDVDYAEVNIRFHAAIHAGAHNPVLAATLADLGLQTLPWRGGQFRARRSRIEDSRREHGLILSAILAQKPDEALQHMRAHVAASFVGILEIVQTISATR